MAYLAKIWTLSAYDRDFITIGVFSTKEKALEKTRNLINKILANSAFENISYEKDEYEEEYRDFFEISIRNCKDVNDDNYQEYIVANIEKIPNIDECDENNIFEELTLDKLHIFL